LLLTLEGAMHVLLPEHDQLFNWIVRVTAVLWIAIDFPSVRKALRAVFHAPPDPDYDNDDYAELKDFAAVAIAATTKFIETSVNDIIIEGISQMARFILLAAIFWNYAWRTVRTQRVLQSQDSDKQETSWQPIEGIDEERPIETAQDHAHRCVGPPAKEGDENGSASQPIDDSS